jgi:hypothetical protein
MARGHPVTTTIIRGKAAAAEMQKMRQQAGKTTNPVTAHINAANRQTSVASKEKAGRR